MNKSNLNKIIVSAGLVLVGIFQINIQAAQAQVPVSSYNPVDSGLPEEPTEPIIGNIPSASSNIIFDQIGPNSSYVEGQNILSSQDFEAAFNGFDVGYVDDFTVNSVNDLNLNSVEAVFATFNGGTAASYNNVLAYNVEFYSSQNAAASSLTGDVASVSVNPGAVTFLNQPYTSEPNSALVSVPIDVDLPSTGTYYVSVIPELNFSGNGQIGVFSSTFAGNNNSFQANPGGGFGLTNNISNLGQNAAYRITATNVPEPSTLIGSIAVGLVALVTRKKTKR